MQSAILDVQRKKHLFSDIDTAVSLLEIAVFFLTNKSIKDVCVLRIATCIFWKCNFNLQKRNFNLQEDNFNLQEGNSNLQEDNFNLQEGNFNLQEGNFNLQEDNFNLQENNFNL